MTEFISHFHYYIMLAWLAHQLSVKSVCVGKGGLVTAATNPKMHTRVSVAKRYNTKVSVLQLSLTEEDRTLLRKGTLEILQLPPTPSLPHNS